MSRNSAYFSGRKPHYQVGLTLLELLVVVAIIAAISGTALVAYSGVEDRANSSQALRNITVMDQTVRQFHHLEKQLPNNLDALIWDDAESTAVYGSGGWNGLYRRDADTVSSGDPISDQGKLTMLHPQLRAATRIVRLDRAAVQALYEAGVNTLRYIDSSVANSTTPMTSGAPATDWSTNPAHVFDLPTFMSMGPQTFPYHIYGKGIEARIVRDGTVMEGMPPKAQPNFVMRLGGVHQKQPATGLPLYYTNDPDNDGTGPSNPQITTVTDYPVLSDLVERSIADGIYALAWVGPDLVADSTAEAFNIPNLGGSSPNDAILLFGIGPNSSLAKGIDRYTQITNMPDASKMTRDQYSNYLMAVRIRRNVMTGPSAEYLGILDPQGFWQARAKTAYTGARSSDGL